MNDRAEKKHEQQHLEAVDGKNGQNEPITNRKGSEVVTPKKTLHDIIPPLNTNNSELKANNSAEVPQFDLAEQILAEQRKVSAGKRTGPGSARRTVKAAPASTPTEFSEPPRQPQKPVIPTESKKQKNKPDTTTKPQTNDIIAEIVARDIAKLSRNRSK